MSEPGRNYKGGALLRLLSSRVRVAMLFSVGLFVWCVAQFYHRDTGFSSLILIGDILNESKVTALRQVPHYVYQGSPGYDGAYYVQIALYPTLDNPELRKAIDNLPYRARRVLFSWAAWLLGLGQPAWVVQAHALLNVACWLVLAWVLLHWFPPTHWENYLRWAGVMFSHGLCMSARNSLVDGPSLLLVALAIRWLETGHRTHGVVTLALAGLGKETNLLASAGTEFDWRSPRTWGRTLLTLAVVVLPLGLWMGYVRWKFGPAEDPGLGNFTYPLAGLIEKWRFAWHDLSAKDTSGINRTTLAAVFALAVQAGFFLVRWRPRERWWRVGAAFAVMMLFLSTPVWEGYPGAATRVLLPMTLAFNVFVPRGRRWLPLLLLGNLTVPATVYEYSPPHEFYQVHGDADLRSAIRVIPATGWHGAEAHLHDRWRWSKGRAELRIVNRAAFPISAVLQAKASSAIEPRRLRVLQGERMLWSEEVGTESFPMRFGLVLPPGETVLVFATDKPGQKVGTDPRDLAFQIANAEMVVSPAPTRP